MIQNILLFLDKLTFIDYVFFFTVVFLIVLIVSLVYFIRVNEEIMIADEKAADPDNLANIVSKIKKEAKPVTFTSYEKEQEDKAIISYDELKNNTKDVELNYAEEEMQGDLTVKKFDLQNLVKDTVRTDPPKSIEVHLMPLAHEEEFLQTLKELQKLLG